MHNCWNSLLMKTNLGHMSWFKEEIFFLVNNKFLYWHPFYVSVRCLWPRSIFNYILFFFFQFVTEGWWKRKGKRTRPREADLPSSGGIFKERRWPFSSWLLDLKLHYQEEGNRTLFYDPSLNSILNGKKKHPLPPRRIFIKTISLFIAVCNCHFVSKRL